MTLKSSVVVLVPWVAALLSATGRVQLVATAEPSRTAAQVAIDGKLARTPMQMQVLYC
jgi:hypothetical protein